jgi:subtilisin family serine protease
MMEGRPGETRPDRLRLARRTVVDPELLDPERRQANQLPEREDESGPVIVELNLLHERGLLAAEARFLKLYLTVVGPRKARIAPLQLTEGYWRCELSVTETRQLVRLDRRASPVRHAIHHVWMDYLVSRLIDHSSRTVKAEASRRLFNADGRAIVWAVLDSGIDATHPHFKTFDTLGGEVTNLHRDFTAAPGDTAEDGALADPFGHGTHVAGIIAGGLPPASEPGAGPRALVAEHVTLMATLGSEFERFDPDRLRQRDSELKRTTGWEELKERRVGDQSRLSGIARRSKLVSLRVLNDQGTGRSSDVIRAMRYVREELNDDGRRLRVHGINLSLGYDFNAKAFACGQTPICIETDRLVRSGVVAVAAAGNTGHGTITVPGGMREATFLSTINDPGNAALAITVGSTHRDSPHSYGVSYFSSKGPTGDGRLKPDVVAPGERITSCAAGQRRKELEGLFDLHATSPEVACYVEDSGTSMAAPHVSGAIAAFLSVRREFIGRAEEVKRIFLDSATSLGRERYFEGHGLLDLLKAIQRV